MRVRSSSRTWLSLTPEPERVLPAAMAVLRGGGGAVSEAAVERERARAEALVLHGRERSYLRWLNEAAALAARGAASADPAVAHAAVVVEDVVRNQAGLLLGLPGGGRRREAARRALDSAVGGSPARRNGGR